MPPRICAHIGSMSFIGIVVVGLIAAAPAAAQEEPGGSPDSDAASPSEASAVSSDAMPLPPLGPMEPGTYVDASTGSRFLFTVGEGWELAVHPGQFQIGPGLTLADEKRAELFLTSFQGQVFTTACWNEENQDAYLYDIGYVSSDADGLIGYLDSHEFLVGVPEGTEVAGYPATQLDVSVQVADGCYSSVALWEIPPDWYHRIRDGNEARFIAADTADGTFVAFVAAPADVYPGFLEQAMRVVDSVSFVTAEG
jgi:hypothetical protein